MSALFRILTRPFVYLLAFAFAAVDYFQGEQEYFVIDDGLDTDVRFFHISGLPVLMFCNRNRPMPNFIVGCKIDADALIPLLDTCWKQYRQEQSTGQRDGCLYTHKPDSLRTFRYCVHEERMKQEDQRVQEEAKRRAGQVRQWLDAGADSNAVVETVNDRRYNIQVGRTALELAQMYHENWIVRLLVMNGAKH